MNISHEETLILTPWKQEARVAPQKSDAERALEAADENRAKTTMNMPGIETMRKESEMLLRAMSLPKDVSGGPAPADRERDVPAPIDFQI